MNTDTAAKMFLVIFFAAVLIALFLITPQPTGYVVIVDPQVATIDIGQEVRVDFRITSVTDLHGFEIDVTYDADVLTYDRIVVQGNFLNQTAAIYSVTPSVSLGSIENILAVRLAETGVTGDGLLFSIYFEGAGPGTSEIRVNRQLLANSNAEPIIQTVQHSEVIVQAPPGDNTPPEVALTLPAQGAFVRGNAVSVAATATDAGGMQDVRFYRGSVTQGNLITTISSPTTPPSTYQGTWNTLLLSDGQHTLIARARDLAQNTADNSRTVTVDNTPPTVQISTPLNNAFVPLAQLTNAPPTIAATANDTTSGIANVQFLANDQQIGTVDTTAPYTTSWTPPSEGVYTLVARATDNAGNTQNSTVQVTVDGTNPTVSFIAPTPAANARVSATTEIRASASDTAPGQVQHVQFLVNGAQVAQDSSSPYVFQWNTASLADGSHTITARATDLAGNTANVSRTFIVDNTGPTVSVTLPAPGTVSGDVLLRASATDPAGMSGVTFLLNGSSIGAGAAAGGNNWEYTWDSTSAQSGSYTLTARATDALGNQQVSPGVAITVDNAAPSDTTPPTVSFTAPAQGATISGTTALTATASDNVGVAGVQFYVNGAVLGAEILQAPYTYTWNTTPLSQGEYTLTARARDLAGNTANTTRTVTVNNAQDTVAPVISITSPLQGSTVSGTITLRATATDNVGIEGVQFFINDQVFGVELTSPVSGTTYERAWPVSGSGTRTIRAVARDAAGNTANSSVTVTIQSAPTPPPSFGGGGGGGGGGAIIPQAPSTSPTTTTEPEEIIPQQTLLVYQGSNEELVLRADATLRGDYQDGAFTAEYITDVDELTNIPENFVLYQGLTFTPRGFAYSDVQSLTTQFVMPRAWIAEQGATVGDVRAYVLRSGTWTSLPTQIVREEAEYVVFRTQADSMSLFAAGVHQVRTQTQPDVQIQEPAPIVTPQTQEPRSFNWKTLAIIVQVLGALVLIAWGFTKVYGAKPPQAPPGL